MAALDDQKRLARLATISALLVVAAFMAAKAARDATLLTHYSIRALPLFVGLSALLSLPVIIIAGKLMVKWGPHRLVPVMNAVSGAVAVGEWMTIHSFPRVVSVIVFFHLSTASAVLVSGFWSIVNERFDIHSAKRHIGQIGMGATLGGILGGVVAERTAVYLQPDSILLVLAGMQMVCAVMLWLFGRGGQTKEELQSESTWRALGQVARTSLLRRAGLVVVITAVGAGALDYVFKADLVHGGSRADLLRTLAVFYTVTNIITAVVQIGLSGPLLTWLGVPRAVSTLPWTITAFGVLTMFVRGPTVATIARGAEFVTRNSIYRAGYELLYAPLAPEQKRPTKVVLDVGADKLGDILAAQLVGAIVYLAVDWRSGLLLAAAAAGGLGVLVTWRLPRAYTRSLEEGLMEKVGELQTADNQPEPWVSLSAMPQSYNHPGDVIPLQFRRRQRKRPAIPAPAPGANATEPLLEVIRRLRSNDPDKLRAVFAKPLISEAAQVAIELVGGSDEVAKLACEALRVAAPRCTGALVDALLDQRRDEKLRRRLPSVIAAGTPELAAWGLWRGMLDPSFDVRYHCGMVLATLSASVHIGPLTPQEVFDYVRRELHDGREVWKTRRLADDAVISLTEVESDLGLAHVFRVLGLVLPAEPLRVALHAVQAEDTSLRGMALEYLESILPPDVRAQLWPLLDASSDAEARASVSQSDPELRSSQLMEELRRSHPGFLEKHHLRKTAG